FTAARRAAGARGLSHSCHIKSEPMHFIRLHDYHEGIRVGVFYGFFNAVHVFCARGYHYNIAGLAAVSADCGYYCGAAFAAASYCTVNAFSVVGDDEGDFAGVEAVHHLVDHDREQVVYYHAVDYAVEIIEYQPSGQDYDKVERKDDVAEL